MFVFSRRLDGSVLIDNLFCVCIYADRGVSEEMENLLWVVYRIDVGFYGIMWDRSMNKVMDCFG